MYKIIIVAFSQARLILACLFAPPLGVLAVWIYIRNGTLQFNIVGSNKTLMSEYSASHQWRFLLFISHLNQYNFCSSRSVSSSILCNNFVNLQPSFTGK